MRFAAWGSATGQGACRQLVRAAGIGAQAGGAGSEQLARRGRARARGGGGGGGGGAAPSGLIPPAARVTPMRKTAQTKRTARRALFTRTVGPLVSKRPLRKLSLPRAPGPRSGQPCSEARSRPATAAGRPHTPAARRGGGAAAAARAVARAARRPGAPLLALLLLLAAPAARGETAVVAERPAAGQLTLLEALQRPSVTAIVLASDVDAGAATQGLAEPLPLNRCAPAPERAQEQTRPPPPPRAPWPGPHAPRRRHPNPAAPAPCAAGALRRNLTVTSADLAAPRILDFGYAKNRLQLCPACTLALRGVAVARDRKGNGGGIDFITSPGWGRVVLQDGFRMRVACIDANTTVSLLHAVALTGHEAAEVVGAEFRGRAFPRSFHGTDAAQRMDRAKVNGTWMGGIDVVGGGSLREWVDAEGGHVGRAGGGSRGGGWEGDGGAARRGPRGPASATVLAGRRRRAGCRGLRPRTPLSNAT
jgi:hypothetical protein